MKPKFLSLSIAFLLSVAVTPYVLSDNGKDDRGNSSGNSGSSNGGKGGDDGKGGKGGDDGKGGKGDDDDNCKIQICHKGRTITVSKSALKGHLGHGDHEGPCEITPSL